MPILTSERKRDKATIGLDRILFRCDLLHSLAQTTVKQRSDRPLSKEAVLPTLIGRCTKVITLLMAQRQIQ